MQAIEEISEQASREWSIEKALEKMRTDWQELTFELAEWKATGTHILRGGPLDEAQTLLDDHIIKSRAMSASPFAKPFAAEIMPWVTRLTRLNAILEQWLTCQVNVTLPCTSCTVTAPRYLLQAAVQHSLTLLKPEDDSVNNRMVLYCSASPKLMHVSVSQGDGACCWAGALNTISPISPIMALRSAVVVESLCAFLQGKWLYLEPIFSSEEIMKQIPKEGSAFRQMDATWRNIMAAVKLNPAIIEVLNLSAQWQMQLWNNGMSTSQSACQLCYILCSTSQTLPDPLLLLDTSSWWHISSCMQHTIALRNTTTLCAAQ